ncbi:uncharacterized protein V1513DRAFT_384698, partial [Lipomyces chichibuensis]|uniref:uncharacterized protein n=1 Tax=Lipomyces chichibuensis TaxID=1546026 RepID=UPI0033430071
KIKEYLGRVSPPGRTHVAIDQIRKCAELALYRAAILTDQLTQMQGSVECQKRKRQTTRSFIASNNILTGAEWQRRTPQNEEVVQREDNMRAAVEETRTIRRCSRCNQSGHTSHTCKGNAENVI